MFIVIYICFVYILGDIFAFILVFVKMVCMWGLLDFSRNNFICLMYS